MPKLGYYEQNFWNRSTFLKKHQILSRRLKESFSGNSVKISDRRTAAGHIAQSWYYWITRETEISRWEFLYFFLETDFLYK